MIHFNNSKNFGAGVLILASLCRSESKAEDPFINSILPPETISLENIFDSSQFFLSPKQRLTNQENFKKLPVEIQNKAISLLDKLDSQQKVFFLEICNMTYGADASPIILQPDFTGVSLINRLETHLNNPTYCFIR